jgi:predicted HNH restriction endonuclease
MINVFESKPFDWRFRHFPQSYPLFIYYHYLNLEDVVEVANEVTNYAYHLHNDLERKSIVHQIHELRYTDNSDSKEFRIYIHDQIEGQYQLICQNDQVSILLFNNGKLTFKNGKKNKFELMDIIKNYNYSYQQAIEEYNPDRKDGILLIFYEQRKAEFYEMEWNEFCLMIDKRVFYTTDSEDDFLNQFIINEDEDKTDHLTEVNLFPDEIKDTETKVTFKEGATSKILVNSYERNPKARQKCIEYYGTNCCICGFDFAEKFGTIGEGFIHVHHLKPLSEIGEEYIIDPIEDMRPICPNCHAMTHRRTPAFNIEEIQQTLLDKK